MTMVTSLAEADSREILKLHDDWFAANLAIDIDAMRGIFVGGDRFHGFNLNGHTYFGIEDWAQLWTLYRKTISAAQPLETKNARVIVNGDVGWLTCDGAVNIKAIQPEGTAASIVRADEQGVVFRFRGTEVYRRSDADGNPVWKMWHCHYSVSAPADEPRPGFSSSK